MYDSVEISQGIRILRVYTAFTEEIGSDYFFAGERHNFWELVYLLEGKVGITAGEDARVMEAGQGVLHSPMEFHRIWYAGVPGKILVFSFQAEGLPPDSAGRFHQTDSRSLVRLLEKTRQEFRMEGIFLKGVIRELDALRVVKEWELFLLELLAKKGPVPKQPRTRPEKNYETIVRVLESSVSRNLSIEEIARQCSMSPVSVKQTFSRYAGLGVMNYYNRLKIQAATAMLREGASVQETATALGFSSQNYFSTVFKRIQGLSPTAYKNRISGK
jgi:AraC-like DNA-binding protein